MTSDRNRVKVRLSALRDIGWELWDPIGIAEHRRNCDDEYDGYLLHVASSLMSGEPKVEGVAYLVDIARGHMGCPTVDRSAAERTVDAVADYVARLRTETA